MVCLVRMIALVETGRRYSQRDFWAAVDNQHRTRGHLFLVMAVQDQARIYAMSLRTQDWTSN